MIFLHSPYCKTYLTKKKREEKVKQVQHQNINPISQSQRLNNLLSNIKYIRQYQAT